MEAIVATSSSRSSSETAVRSLRILMLGYQLWGSRSATDIEDLAGMLRLPPQQVSAVLDELIAEGLIRLDARGAAVTLTRAGACALDIDPPSAPM